MNNESYVRVLHLVKKYMELTFLISENLTRTDEGTSYDLISKKHSLQCYFIFRFKKELMKWNVYGLNTDHADSLIKQILKHTRFSKKELYSSYIIGPVIKDFKEVEKHQVEIVGKIVNRLNLDESSYPLLEINGELNEQG